MAAYEDTVVARWYLVKVVISIFVGSRGIVTKRHRAVLRSPTAVAHLVAILRHSVRVIGLVKAIAHSGRRSAGQRGVKLAVSRPSKAGCIHILQASAGGNRISAAIEVRVNVDELNISVFDWPAGSVCNCAANADRDDRIHLHVSFNFAIGFAGEVSACGHVFVLRGVDVNAHAVERVRELVITVCVGVGFLVNRLFPVAVARNARILSVFFFFFAFP